MVYSDLAREFVQILSDNPPAWAQYSISPNIRGQNFVLFHLAASGCRAAPKALSDKMKVSTARVAAILRNLEKNGLITRSPDPDDGRQIIVALTDKGRDLADRYKNEALEKITGILEYLGPDDAESFIRIQKKLLRMNQQQHRQ